MAISTSKIRYYADTCFSTHFKLVDSQIEGWKEELDEFRCTDTADGVLSKMTSSKFGIYPFISVQKDFGYSDVTARNNREKGHLSTLFELEIKNVEEIKLVQYDLKEV